MTTFAERVDQRLTQLGLNDHAVSLLISDGQNKDIIRDIRRRGTVPKGQRFDRLAEALEVTVGWLRHGVADAGTVGDRRTGFDAGSTATSPAHELPRSLPVHGTTLGCDVTVDDAEIETHILELSDSIDFIRRPAIFQGRNDVYALYVTGSSMEPRFEPGDPVIVDPRRPPRPGDDVIVQLVDTQGEVRLSLIKRLVRRTARTIELRQYNPALTFILPLDRVRELHRVVMLRDLLG